MEELPEWLGRYVDCKFITRMIRTDRNKIKNNEVRHTHNSFVLFDMEKLCLANNYNC